MRRSGEKHPDYQEIIAGGRNHEWLISVEPKRIASSLEQEAMIARARMGRLQASLNQKKWELAASMAPAYSRPRWSVMRLRWKSFLRRSTTALRKPASLAPLLTLSGREHAVGVKVRGLAELNGLTLGSFHDHPYCCVQCAGPCLRLQEPAEKTHDPSIDGSGHRAGQRLAGCVPLKALPDNAALMLPVGRTSECRLLIINEWFRVSPSCRV